MRQMRFKDTFYGANKQTKECTHVKVTHIGTGDLVSEHTYILTIESNHSVKSKQREKRSSTVEHKNTFKI